MTDTRISACKLTAGFLCAGLLAWWRHSPAYVFFFSLACGTAAAAIFFPGIVSAFLKAMRVLFHWMGVALLGIFYFLVVFPWGMLYRNAVRREKRNDSSWTIHPDVPAGKERYERQF